MQYCESISSAASSLSLTLSGGGNVGLIQATSTTAYDFDGNVTATFDATGDVTATAYDYMGNDVADYKGQELSGASPTFMNLNSNSLYDLYALNGTATVSGVTATDPNPPNLGGGWALQRTFTLPAGTTSLAVTASVPVCLVAKTSASTYDKDGNALSTTDGNGNTTSYKYNALNQQTSEQQPSPTTPGQTVTTQTTTDVAGRVTATIDPMGRVSATTYDAFGRAAETYQGQVEPSGTAFQNLTPNATAYYDVYTTGLSTPSFSPTVAPETSDPNAPTLGAGLQFYGTISTSASSLTVTASGGDLCLVELTSTTAYDNGGKVTATFDAMDKVKATAYDDSGNDVADYQGQELAVSGGSTTFNNLTPNYQNWYDVYTQGGSLSGFTSSGTDPSAPNLGRAGAARESWL